MVNDQVELFIYWLHTAAVDSDTLESEMQSLFIHSIPS